MADLLVEKTNHLGILKLNRPDRMNAISVEMLKELGEALKDFDSDPKVRAIILTGEGRGFCSGLDLKDTAAGRGIGAGLAAPGASHVSTRELPTVTLNRIDLAGDLRDQWRGGGLRIRPRTRMRPAADQRSRQAGAGIRQARNRARERRHLVSAAAGRMGARVRNRIYRRRYRARPRGRAGTREQGRAA